MSLALKNGDLEQHREKSTMLSQKKLGVLDISKLNLTNSTSILKPAVLREFPTQWIPFLVDSTRTRKFNKDI